MGVAHILAALDHSGELRAGSGVSGWMLCSQRIEDVFVRDTAGERRRVTFGLPRPDADAAFPGHLNGEACGFVLPSPPTWPDLELEIETSGSGRARRVHRATLYLDALYVQRIALASGAFDSWRAERAEARLARALSREPDLTLTVDIINKCNLRCVMCHYSDPEVSGRPRREMGIDQFRELFEDLSPQVRKVMLSCADEPLLSSQFPRFLSYLSEGHPHVEVSFVTNGMLLSDKVRRQVIESGVVELVVSLDGVRKATVERIRTGSSFERIVGNLLALRELKVASASRFPLLTLSFVMFRSNVCEAPIYVELARRIGARAIDFRHVVPSDYFPGEGELLSSEPARYDHFRAKVVEAGRRTGVVIIIPPPLGGGSHEPSDEVADLGDLESVPVPDVRSAPPPPARRPADYVPRCHEAALPSLTEGMFCDRPFTDLLIAQQEIVRPCPFYGGSLGRLGDGRTLREIYLGPRARLLRRNMRRPEGDPGCASCPIKGGYLTQRAVT